MVGEKGPEAIIPLSKMGTERPMVVNIHVNGADPNQVVDALKRYARQNGAIPVRTMNP
jgi:phosphotransferase system HPr-like phosphotransfer protein